MNAILQEIYEQYGGWLTPEEESELFSIAVHEAAHGLVAAHFGLDSDECVVSASVGVCVHSVGSTLANAAISWAGVIGETLLKVPNKGRTFPKTPLTGLTLHKWLDEVRLQELSIEDRRGIESHSSKLESARLAFEILTERREALEFLAHSLARRSREKFATSVTRSARQNEADVQRFISEQKEAARFKAAEDNARRAVAQMHETLASLPPVTLPEKFDFESFQTATGASEQEIYDFQFARVLRERNKIGLGAPTEKTVSDAVQFFRDSCVQSRDIWIFFAREFYNWRNNQPRRK